MSSTIPGYIRPQVLIRQQFASIAPLVVQNQNAFIFGPNYVLRRYTDTDEQALIGIGAYDLGSDVPYAYPNRPGNTTIDTDFAKVFVKTALLEYFQDLVGSGSVIRVAAAANRNRVRASSLIFKTANGSTRSGAFLRDVQIGDRVSVTGTPVATPITRKSRVTGFVADLIASAVAAAANSDSNLATQAADVVSSLSVTKVGLATDITGALTGTYKTDLANGLAGDTYTVACTTGGDVGAARFRITNASATVDVSGVKLDGALESSSSSSSSSNSSSSSSSNSESSSSSSSSSTSSSSSSSNSESSSSSSSSSSSGAFPEVGVLQHSSLRGVILHFLGSAATWVAGEKWLWTVNALFTKLTSQFVSGGAYSGPKDTTYVLTVVQGGGFGSAKVRLIDSQGVDVSEDVTVSAGVAFDIGTFGVTFQFSSNPNTESGAFVNGGLRLGDAYAVAVTAAKDGAVRTLVLADSIDSAIKAADEVSPTDLELHLYIFKSEVEIPENRAYSPPDLHWVAAEDNITINAGVLLQDSSWVDGLGDLPFLPLSEGSLFVEYRALNRNGASTISSISDIGNIDQLGAKVDVLDPLTYGVYQALLNSGGRTVYYARVPTDDLDGYLAVLNAATQTSLVYAFAPTTLARDVHDAVTAHTLAMSSPTKRKWRKAYLAEDLVTESTVLALKVDNTTPFTGTITGMTPNFKTVTILGATMLDDGIRAGDLVDINFQTDGFGVESFDTFTVNAVSTQEILTLVSGPAAAIGTAIKIRIRRPLTKDEQAEAFGVLANHFAERRASLCFPPTSNYLGKSQPGWAIACGIAGLRSSVVPQQGLTNAQLLGVDDIPLAYSYFNSDQLDLIASHGVYIVAQDEASGAVYIRHQLTTDITSLLTREDSITTNVDSMSFTLLNRLAPYIGRFNNTPAFRQFLGTVVRDTINFLSGFASAPTSDANIGPQLITGEILQLTTAPGAQDTIILKIKLTVPSPLNVIDTTLEVTLES